MRAVFLGIGSREGISELRSEIGFISLEFDSPPHFIVFRLHHPQALRGLSLYAARAPPFRVDTPLR